jgi:hypothetical protein
MAGRINSTFELADCILLGTSSVICFAVILLFAVTIIFVHAKCQKKPTPQQRTIYHQPPANNVYWKSDSTAHLV